MSDSEEIKALRKEVKELKAEVQNLSGRVDAGAKTVNGIADKLTKVFKELYDKLGIKSQIP